MRRSSAVQWAIIGLVAGLAIEADICFAQGGAGGGASGSGTSTGGISGGTGGISGGGISTGGVLGGISGGGTANQIGPGGNAGASGTIGSGSSGIHEGVVPSNPGGVAPNSLSPGRLPGNGSRRSALPRSRGASDPLGLGSPSPSSGRRRGRVGRPEDLGPAGRAAIGDAMTNYDVWSGVAYFPRKGMYEDMIYGTRRGASYRANSGGRPTLSGGPARRAGVLGDRSINREGIPRTLRRVTPRQQLDRAGYPGPSRR